MNRTGRRAFALALFWASCLTLALSQSADRLPMVDFRLAPLEQARKVHAAVGAAGPTMTIMRLRTDTTAGDYRHLILTDESGIPPNLPGQLRELDGISWNPGDYQSSSACDSQGDCERRTDEMCNAAGHGGVLTSSVHIAHHADGTRTCSGNCQSNGAIAFVTCGSASCLLCD